jgi:hypothetical protein
MPAFRASVRRWIARLDPEWEPRAKKSREDCIVDHTANPDGTAELFIRGPIEIIAELNLAMNAYAAKSKAELGGTVAQRKIAGLRDMTERYLGCEDAPQWHGRPPTVNVTIDAATLLGLANHPGEIPGVGMVPADTARWLLADGAPLRRFLIEEKTGALLDYGTSTYLAPPRLADFLCAKNVTSAAPHSNVDSRICDMEHNTPHDQGGRTDPVNTTPVDRRWHRAKTHAGWSYKKNPKTGTLTWYSPNGLTFRIEPHDYRLGP